MPENKEIKFRKESEYQKKEAEDPAVQAEEDRRFKEVVALYEAGKLKMRNVKDEKGKVIGYELVDENGVVQLYNDDVSRGKAAEEAWKIRAQLKKPPNG